MQFPLQARARSPKKKKKKKKEQSIVTVITQWKTRTLLVECNSSRQKAE